MRRTAIRDSHHASARMMQEDLAPRMGFTPQAVGFLERGERRRPHAYTVQVLGEARDQREASVSAAVLCRMFVKFELQALGPRVTEERGVEKADERTGEDRQELTARELIELPKELRVILPGVQVLFAFLLTVTLTQRFPQLDDLETGVFFMTLLCTAIATALLIAPSARHRMLWRSGVREERLELGNVLTIAGLVFLVPAMVGDQIASPQNRVWGP